MKKALALILSVMMIMSLCVVSVSATFVSNTGNVIISDDFEDYTLDASPGGQVADKGTYGYYYLGLMDKNGDKVWSSQVAGGGVEWQNKLSGAQAVTSGKVAISYDVTVVSGYEGELSGDYYPSIYHGHWGTSSYEPLFAIGYLCGNRDDALGGVMLTGGYGISAADVDAENVYTFSADEPHEIKIVMDYDAKTTTLYVDDYEVGSIERTVKFVSGGGSYIAMKPHSHLGSVYSNQPEILIHGWAIEKVVDEGPAGPTGPTVDADGVATYFNYTFDDASELVAANFDYIGSSSVSNGVLQVPNGQYPSPKLPSGLDTNGVYEFSYKVKASGEGRTISYGYGGSDLNAGAYLPGAGFSIGNDLNGAYVDNTDATQWYTIKTEFSMNPADTYVYYRIYNEEGSVIASKRVDHWKDTAGNDIASPSIPGAMYLWNVSIADGVQYDDISFKKLPVGYDYTTYDPQIWVAGNLPTSATTIAVGDKIEAQAYGEKGGTLIVAAYNEDGSLKAVKSVGNHIRDEYKLSFDADAEFAGAAEIKAFLFKGIADGKLQPITNAVGYTLATVA